jgi:hypothetical protein
MMRFLVMVGLLAFSSATFGMDSARANAWCKQLFGISAVRSTGDTEADTLTREFLRMANLNVEPVVCITNNQYELDVAQSTKITSGSESYFFIALDARFRMEIKGELRGVIAHEVAHIPLTSMGTCGGFLRRNEDDRYVSCESSVDLLAESWAGKGEVARSLSFVSTYIQEFYGEAYPGAKSFLSYVKKRIWLLERSQAR